jgi:hypothetical protein
VKKILTLEKIISLQKTIESMITDTQVKIIANNPVLVGDESEENVPELYTKYKALLEQLSVVKLAKDRANKKRSLLGGVTNQELILELGNKNKNLAMLVELFKSKQNNRKGKKAPAYEFQMSKNSISDEIDAVTERISEIKDSMTKFNKKTTAKVVIFKELNLL